MQRPTGVAILAGLLIVLGVLAIMGGISSLMLSSAAARQGLGAVVPTSWLAWANIIVGIAELVVGYGLWGMHKWAWLVAIVVLALNVVAQILALFSPGWPAALLGLVLSAVVIWYLTRPDVKKAFGRG